MLSKSQFCVSAGAGGVVWWWRSPGGNVGQVGGRMIDCVGSTGRLGKIESGALVETVKGAGGVAGGVLSPFSGCWDGWDGRCKVGLGLVFTCGNCCKS